MKITNAVYHIYMDYQLKTDIKKGEGNVLLSTTISQITVDLNFFEVRPTSASSSDMEFPGFTSTLLILRLRPTASPKPLPSDMNS
jgi:hypothetical protein